MSTEVLVGYWVGFVLWMVCAIVVGELASTANRPGRPVRLLLAALSGVLWPVVAIGVLQGMLVVTVVKHRRASAHRRTWPVGAYDDRGSVTQTAARSSIVGCRRLIGDAGDPASRKVDWAAVESHDRMNKAI